jgi:hypothetical protein
MIVIYKIRQQMFTKVSIGSKIEIDNVREKGNDNGGFDDEKEDE